MKLKSRLIISYTIIAVFLVVVLIIAYMGCGIICKVSPTVMKSGMRLFNWFSIAALFVALIFSQWFANKISGPLKILTDKTQDIANGNYSEKINLRTNTVEVDTLINSVNNLAATLEGQRQVKRRMANDYAHEFRTPLAAIQSNLEGIIDGVFEPSIERLEDIREEILRLSRMVSQIDNLVALENDGIDLNMQSFDLKALLTQTISTFEAAIFDKKINLKLDMTRCEITADKDKISSVIINLISNAIKYTDIGGNIVVSLVDNKSHVAVIFADSGVGIAKKDLPHIFEHLYRTDTSRTRNTGGSGIGLSVTKAIVAAHSGTIDVKSEVDNGSVFTVVLPKR